ncbi:MAG: integrase, partial [Gammaproteobacteria bacterium]|nr:integrase [Gammaproteobacteria bacterium]
MSATSLAALIQRFFTRRLQTELGASAHTVAAYRDTFRLLLAFASARLAREPSNLRLEDLDAAF